MLLKQRSKRWRRPVQAQDALSYRIPHPVTRVRQLCRGASYPVCPRCDSNLDREYVRFCDRCGQRLQWAAFSVACVTEMDKHEE